MAQDDLAARLIIVANSLQPESMRLAEYYAEKRNVPRANIIALPMSEAETISWREFIDKIYQPLQDELCKRGLLEATSSTLVDSFGRKRYGFNGNKISYLVTCRGVPLRILNEPTMLDEKKRGTTAPEFFTNEASVDSELSMLAQSGYDPLAMTSNPLLNKEQPSIFDVEAVVKVSRLDGPTIESARRLVSNAIEAEKQGLIGRYYVDIGGPHKDGDTWLEQTDEIIRSLGFDGSVDRDRSTLGPEARFDSPALYFGWYVSNIHGPMASPDFRFPVGAIALHIHSFSAITMRSDLSGWVGPMVARGVTATVGNVFEPYLHLTHRPNLLMKALAEGKNWGDAVYYSLPALSWKCIAIGDPLYRPFKVSLEEQEQREASLPFSYGSYVALRRAHLLQQAGKNDEAIMLLKRAARERPDFAISVGLARAQIAVGQRKEATDTLAFLSMMPSIRPNDWALMREAAQLLSDQDAKPISLKIYTMLARTKAPSPEALRQLLTEARRVADGARDLKASLEFARQLNELTNASQAVPASK